MVFLRSDLKKKTFFAVFKLFITKVCLQPVVVSRIKIRLIPM